MGTFRSMKKLSQDDELNLKSLLIDLNNYYSKKNIEVLTWFRDFDRNRIGLVTENQVSIAFILTGRPRKHSP